MLENHLKNPVVLYGHDYYDPPVARTTSIGFDPEGRLIFTPQFADVETPAFADIIFRHYEGGYMRAFSVSVIPLEMEGDTFTSVDAASDNRVATTLSTHAAGSAPASRLLVGRPGAALLHPLLGRRP